MSILDFFGNKRRETVSIQSLITKLGEEGRESLDQFRFLGNYPPTPPLSQHHHLLLS